MRTTIAFDDQLLKDAKKAAAESGTTLAKWVEDAVRESLARREAPRKRIVLPTFKGNGVRPGVDLYDSSSLLDLMDEEDETSGR